MSQVVPSQIRNVVQGQVDRHLRPAVRWGLLHRLPRTVMNTAARRGDLQGELIVAGSNGDPFPVLDRMRSAGPLYRAKFGFVATSVAAVREVLGSNDFRTGFPRLEGDATTVLGRLVDWAAPTGVLGPVEPPSLLVTEPPDHTRYRKLVTRVFTVKAVQQLRERTEQVAAELLDDIERSAGGADVVDIVETYCTLLPVTVIAEILGVPASEREKVLAFGAAAAPSLDMGLSWTTFRSVERALRDFDHWLGEHLETLRRNPGEDLLSQLVVAQEDGVGLTEIELKATAGLVLAAGFETTVNLLSNGIALLADHRDQLQTLVEDPAHWPTAVDEILRFDPPVLLTGRTALRDTTVAGVPVAAGSLVTTVLAGANRDPEVFTDPARFDVTRANAKDHVAFSSGRHFCLGAALARMEGEVGLRTIFDRYPELTVLSGGTRRPTRILRGYETLPVRLGTRVSSSV